ncbi:MAG TPA: BON domain-containing protein [Thermoanaerobaculia bacterium]|nr:BON domain-containing protein [Thermoanaerobaculia bacterium]
MTTRSRSWLLTLLLLPLALAAISDTEEKRPPSGADLEERVRSALLRLPDYGVFDQLSFRVDGDLVTLDGAVHRAIVKTEAEEALTRTPGVGRVLDRARLLPVSTEDDRVRREVFWRIYTDDFLAKHGTPAAGNRIGSHPVRIIVENRNVSLCGAVNSDADRARAGAEAGRVAGVRSVVNEIRVAGD